MRNQNENETMLEYIEYMEKKLQATETILENLVVQTAVLTASMYGGLN